MKNEINNTTILQNSEMNVLFNQSKNSFSMATTNTHKPSFGTADFWNVQKMKRDRVYRRYM
jgi:hypothetical protein